MSTGHYVEGLSNQQRLLAVLEAAQHRGATEASWIMAVGEAGFGKSKTLAWLGIKRQAVMVRAKADWTPLWMLNELAEALGVARQRTKQRQFETVLGELLNKQPLIIVDEIDHVARKLLCLETLRDITDMSECVLVAGGTKTALETMKGHKQLHSRIFDVVTWGAASEADIAAIAEALIDVKVGDDLLAEIRRRSEGRLRLVMNALARVEAFGRKQRLKTVTAEAFGTRQLTNDERFRPSLVVANNG